MRNADPIENPNPEIKNYSQEIKKRVKYSCGFMICSLLSLGAAYAFYLLYSTSNYDPYAPLQNTILDDDYFTNNQSIYYNSSVSCYDIFGQLTVIACSNPYNQFRELVRGHVALGLTALGLTIGGIIGIAACGVNTFQSLQSCCKAVLLWKANRANHYQMLVHQPAGVEMGLPQPPAV